MLATGNRQGKARVALSRPLRSLAQFLNTRVFSILKLLVVPGSALLRLEAEKAALADENRALEFSRTKHDADIAELRTTEAEQLASDGGEQARFLKLARMFFPRTAVGRRKIRIGRETDGGYVMLDDFDDIASAFSFGIADDASWDLDIAERGIRTYQFDHTINRAPSAHPNLVFTARKIAAS
jgi:hypothetical protein